ncbi:septum formation family protein [Streptomyces sp. V3I7]|uniref:septum formation family protein n=1 Tax=Streptomyces sp. V3I7 TaxID=3042278 RepID=UPI0027883A53|nr:septum formation family protein [Streptomyces sp. V3I7]MDQ0991512.1 hypothetical protein [Streptomyces sp. V3I7]
MKARTQSRSLRGISAVVALLAVGAVGCSDLADSAADGAKKAVRTRSVFSLGVGDCFNPDGKATGEALTVEIVPCGEAHRGQVVGDFSLPGKKAFPGDKAVSAVADQRCPAEAGRFSLDTWALPKGVDVFYYTPTKDSWATGDRAVSCTYTKESGTFTGSLKADAKSMKPAQAAYLKGANAVYDTLWANQSDADYVEDDLSGYKRQAKAVAAALDAHLKGLRGVQGAEVGKLRAQLEKSAVHWEKAAKAPDADAFFLDYDPAFAGIDPHKTVAARKELGLATTVPADDAKVWAD